MSRLTFLDPTKMSTVIRKGDGEYSEDIIKNITPFDYMEGDILIPTALMQNGE